MHEIPRSRLVAQSAALIVLLSLITACGGSGTAGDGTGTPTSSTGSSGGTAPSPPPATILFEQPDVAGIAGHFVVPPATHTPPPKSVFGLVLWQPNRFQSSGELIPTAWDAGSRTAFTPSVAASAQLGFQNLTGTSTAQMEGDTVGAYIDSADLPPSSADQKMMITPQFLFPSGSEPVPFANPKTVLSGSMDLQIPTAVGRDTYVVLDLLFMDPNGVRISYGVAVFHNGASNPAVGSGVSDNNTFMLNSPLGVDERFVTRATDSDSATGTPWSGWRHFEWSISEAQFASALQYLVTAFPGKVALEDPAQYLLAEVHLNAEFHTNGQPAQLGWSMRGLKLWTSP